MPDGDVNVILLGLGGLLFAVWAAWFYLYYAATFVNAQVIRIRRTADKTAYVVSFVLFYKKYAQDRELRDEGAIVHLENGHYVLDEHQSRALMVNLRKIWRDGKKADLVYARIISGINEAIAKHLEANPLKTGGAT